MTASTEWLDDDLRALFAGATGDPGPHPSEEDWIRFDAGTLTAAERTRLGDHVASCSACRDVFRVVRDVQLGAPVVAVAADGNDEAAERPAPAAGATRARQARSWLLLALAASLLVTAAVGWSAWALATRVGELELQIADARPASEVSAIESRLRDAEDRARDLMRDLAAAREPGVNVPIVDLLPDAARGAGATPIRITLETDARYVAFVVTVPSDAVRRAPLSVELLGADGRRVGEWDGLRISPFGTSSLVVPAALLPAGRHTARVRDAAGAVVQSHALLVAKAPAQ
jgi:hypothetical protein